MNPQQTAAIARDLANDITRVLTELDQLSEDASKAGLHRCKMRIDRARESLRTCPQGLRLQASKIRIQVD